MSKRVLLLVLAIGCSDAKKQSAGVGPAGGSVSLGDGTAATIPAGALAGTTTITVGTTDGTPTPAGTERVGQAYLFGPEGQTFAQPVTVTLAVAIDQLPANKTLGDVVILTAPAGSSAYQPMPTTIVDNTHVSTATTHFSVFVPCIFKDGEAPDFAHLVADQSVPADQAFPPGTDLSGIDMSTPLTDMSSSAINDAGPDDGPCTHNFVMGGQTAAPDCTETAVCHSHMYQMSCSPAELSNMLCLCSVDGTVVHSHYITGANICTSSSSADGEWTSGCMFP